MWKGNGGIGFDIKQELARFVLDVCFVNERIMWMSVKLEGGIYRFVSLYSPCEGSDSLILRHIL